MLRAASVVANRGRRASSTIPSEIPEEFVSQHRTFSSTSLRSRISIADGKSGSASIESELEKAGAVLNGPISKAILDTGDKIHSKNIATAARVSMIPGFDGEIRDEDMCVKVSRDIGYPVMIKASAGGGGMGMRVAWNDKQAREGYRLSKQEAASLFGDDRMLVEKFIENPRHIQMQILCDKNGNALWLNERERSFLKKNQRVIEEVPSIFMPPEMRRKIGEQAVQLANAVGYDSAGIVEFLVDSQRNYYSVQINSCLQVKISNSKYFNGIQTVCKIKEMCVELFLQMGFPVPVKLVVDGKLQCERIAYNEHVARAILSLMHLEANNLSGLYWNLKPSNVLDYISTKASVGSKIFPGKIPKNVQKGFNERMFLRVLIATRGEIACRIIKTSRQMGVYTIAVYTKEDENAFHVSLADASMCIGETIDSYEDFSCIITAVRNAQVEAVHPGDNVLALSKHFIEELEKEGVHIVGPSARAIQVSDKINSKKAAAAAGISIIPGFDGEIRDEDMCVKVSRDIGYPVMIKASAGGGGKGMRVAWNDKQAREGYRLSKKEAASSFGDDRILVEKFIDNPRHIEMQILCDKKGNALWLNETECTYKVNNDRIIEESPSYIVTPEMRRKMGEQAVQLAKAVGYDSAGTVEFLVDSKRNLYFMGVKCCIQHHHSLNHKVTGIDIVQQMLRIAYGHALPLTQEQVPLNGWAIASRVYAKNPNEGFVIPHVGGLPKYSERRHFDEVYFERDKRIPFKFAEYCEHESNKGIYFESSTGIGFGLCHRDSMICKVVSHGENRQQALDRMQEALDNYIVRGITHNIPLLRDIVQEKRFLDGNITTKYLADVYPEGFQGTKQTSNEQNTVIAFIAVLKANKLLWSNALLKKNRQRSTYTPYSKTFRFVAALCTKEGERPTEHAVEVTFVNGNGNKAKVWIGGKTVDISGNLSLCLPVNSIEVNGEHITTQIVGKRAGEITVLYKGTPFKVKVLPEHAVKYLQYMKEKAKVDLSTVVLSPMPGAIKNVNVKPGDMVSEGQELVVMDAMKMHNSLHAGKTRRVEAVNVKAGSTVDDEEVLVELI